MKLSVASLLLLLAALGIPQLCLAKQIIRGEASWYGKAHQGRRMANGRCFDRHKFTAASRTIPLGRKARVTNLRTGRRVIVTITDRGPKRRDRVIDLSEAAAAAIGIKARGVGRVAVKELP